MTGSIKKSVLALLALLSLAIVYQNCAQTPFGADGQSSNQPSYIQGQDSNVEILLVDHEVPVVRAGDRVTLTVNFEAVGADYYEWVRVLPFRGKEVIAKTQSPQLIFQSFQEVNVGDYQVIAVFGDIKNESPILTIVIQN